MLVALNNALAFMLELATLAILARWGWSLSGHTVARVVLATAFAGVAAVLWARFGAPSSASRLDGWSLMVFKTIIFGTGAIGVLMVYGGVWAIAFAALAAVQLVLAWSLGIL